MKHSKPSDKFFIVPFEKLKSSRAWKLTSEYVRRLSKGICYTCGKKDDWRKFHAGHFIEKRGHCRIYFDLRGLKAQCPRCNRQLHGAKDIYAAKLIKETGSGEIIKDLINASHGTKQWTREELKKIEVEREKLIKELDG